MYYRYVALIIFACTFATLSPLRTLAATPARILISEVQWGGSALSTADEWIELANPSSEAVDISSWKITGAASQGAEITLPEGTLLASHATYLIANYASGDAKTVLTVQPNLVTTSVSLSNSALSIMLFDEDGVAVDTFLGTDAGTSSPHASAERNLETTTWLTASTVTNMLGLETFGSPGYATFPQAEPVQTNETPEPTLAEEPIEEPLLETSVSTDEPSALVQDSTDAFSSDDPLLVTDLSTPEEEIPLVEEQVIPEENAPEEITLITPVIPDVVTAVVVEEPEKEPEVLEDTSDEEESSLEVEIQDTSTASSQTSVTQHVTTIITEVDYSPLQVSEFVSNPSDGNEWIEFFNSGDTTLSLENIGVEDATGKATLLSGSLLPNAYYVLENPSGKLNNDGDSIIVTLSDGQVLFSLVYGTADFPEPEKGTSAGYCTDGWHTDLSPSPALANTCPSPTLEITTYENDLSTSSTLNSSSTTQGASSALQGDASVAEDTSTAPPAIAPVTTSVVTESTTPASTTSSETTATPKTSKKKTPSKNTVLALAVQDLDKTVSGQHVAVTGTIIAEPGIFGKRIAYLQGVQLYFYKATWPSLPAGTSVRITGTWDYDGDTRRIKISNASDIEILGSAELEPISWDDVSPETPENILVTASGTLMKKEGDVFLFSSITGKDFRVTDEAKTGALAALRAGDVVTLTGILFPADGNWILTPRSADDVALSTPPPALDTSSLPQATLMSAPHTNPTPIIGGGILASSVSALGYWFLRSRKLSFLFS